MLRITTLYGLVTTFVCLFTPTLAQQKQPDSTAHKSRIAFQLHQSELITEGLAYNPQTKTFYISSVRERRIISYDASGNVANFSASSDSLWGVFGMKVDPDRRLLWACSSALVQADGITAAEEGRTALVAYDLRTKRKVATYPVAADGKRHLLGDLTIAKNGDVYTTDSRTPWLYHLAAGTTTVKPLLTDSLFRSLQGLAFSEDGKTLYVADYRNGPLAVDVATKRVTRLTSTQTADLSGIDGLYYYRNSLIAIQNRRKPFRVSRLYLSKTTPSIERTVTLESGHPLMTEPTLGVLVGNQFYYVANSQWEAFDEAGKPVPNFPAQKPTILVVPVD
ncbi:SMP-30/gluconolactonase/LRE family protein [Spirosoma sp. BT702]|uniref:SMP-30/gluconolactonase/LRE family protein n=1 Tax=Spirosoma profusum TaxID=2771354 RepID=A0A927AUY7_9BACT|nr:SMP-30/gluconolactonase/LRE family protein [Spirosoma profusum]MBD2704892.1 SMP-30/gluconolactonase/LRE family protein [Spirosoma profusum]